jgi:hypothetical protein
MRKSVPFALAIAGIGAGVYFLTPGAGKLPGGKVLAPAHQVTASGTTRPTSAAVPGSVSPGRAYTSSQPLLATQRPASGQLHAAGATDQVAAGTAPTPPSVAPAIAPVTIDPFIAPSSPQRADSAARRLSSSRPADEDARRELVKDLQRELKRVGCYDGDISGTWAPASKKAMAAFNERVNATLPLDEPDYILLTLVQGHGAQACGKGCPAGQGMNDAGKCVPSAILAQTVRRTGDKTVTAAAGSPKTASKQEIPRAAKPIDAPRAGRPIDAPRAGSLSWSTIVTEAPQSAQPAPQLVQPPRMVAQAAPLPGRMSVGAAEAPAAGPTEQERIKAELAKRKAELTAAAEAQRNADTEADRKVRLADAQARKAKEALAAKAAKEAQAAKQAEAAQKKAKVAKTTEPAPEPVAAAAAPTAAEKPMDAGDASVTDTAAIAAAARKSVLRKAENQISEKRVSEASRPIQQPAPRTAPGPTRVTAAPYRVPPSPRFIPPYAVGAPMAYVPRSTYAVEPRRWTRTIFSDITRVR